MKKLFRKLYAFATNQIDQNVVGQEAGRLLEESSAFMISMEAVQWKYMQEWMDTPPEAVDKRENLKMRVDLLRELISEIDNVYSQHLINKEKEAENGAEQTKH